MQLASEKAACALFPLSPLCSFSAFASLLYSRYDISSIARKTGISSATQLAKLVPKGEKGEREEPDIEWLEKLVDF